jgi:hypothetical protein
VSENVTIHQTRTDPRHESEENLVLVSLTSPCRNPMTARDEKPIIAVAEAWQRLDLHQPEVRATVKFPIYWNNPKKPSILSHVVATTNIAAARRVLDGELVRSVAPTVH